MPTYWDSTSQVTGYLAAGRLKRLLVEFEPAPLPIHVLHRDERQASVKVGTFVDLLVERLRGDVALKPGDSRRKR